MPGIKYFNAVSQFLMAGLVISVFLFSMGNKPRAYVLRLSSSYQITNSPSRHSSRWKYKISTLIFAVLMIYVIFAAVMCAIQAANQGGPAYNLMLFSIIITYGSMSFASKW